MENNPQYKMCFYCNHYKHLDPETDVCVIFNTEVYFDTHFDCTNYEYDGGNLQ